MNTRIISIGDELLKGEICNSNAVYISDRLKNMGIDTDLIINLPDNIVVAKNYISKITSENGIYIFTGGLGGTRDDITRKIISDVFEVEFVIYEEGLKKLEKWYREKGREFRDSDRSQAMIPEGGIALENNVGLAYGFYFESKGRHIFSLPGVPAEIKDMFEKNVIKTIRDKGLLNKGYRSEFLIFTDIAEYTLDAIIGEIIDRCPGVYYGTRSNNGIIRVRIESKEIDLDDCVNEIISKLENYLITRGNKTLEEVLGEILKNKSLTLSSAESCTAGYLSKTITNISGSSSYFLGGIVCYSNDVKRDIVGVKSETLKRYGAVSSQTAEELAKGVMERLNSDIGVSITGIAGPTGGTPDKPVGTVYIGVSCRKNNIVKSYKNYFKGDRDTIRIRSVNRALSILIKLLREN